MSNVFDIFRNKKPKSTQVASWEEVASILEPYKRKAWKPKVKEGTSHPARSKFSGIPVLEKGESWPCCKNCKQPMQLFLQLNSRDLPKEVENIFGGGILQVFYCTNWDQGCEVECEAYSPFSCSTLLRVVQYENEDVVPFVKSPVKDAYPEQQIIEWQFKYDYPNWEELEALEVTLTEEQSDALCDSQYPRAGDKLFGWPNWSQGVEYPLCPDCGEPMKLIFQIDSDDNLPYMFGDQGCAHITQCEKHPHRIAIAWACS